MLKLVLSIACLAIMGIDACWWMTRCPRILCSCRTNRFYISTEYSAFDYPTLTLRSGGRRKRSTHDCGTPKYKKVGKEMGFATTTFGMDSPCVKGKGTAEDPAFVHVDASGVDASGHPFSLRFTFPGFDLSKGLQTFPAKIEDPQGVVKCRCRNGGSCVPNNITMEYDCACLPGFIGKLCECERDTPCPPVLCGDGYKAVYARFQDCCKTCVQDGLIMQDSAIPCKGRLKDVDCNGVEDDSCPDGYACTMEGYCCPVCDHNGQVYRVGQSYMDKCNRCRCKKTGKMAKMTCSDRPCKQVCKWKVDSDVDKKR